MTDNAQVGLIFLAVFVVILLAIVYGHWWQTHGGGKLRRELRERRKLERAASARARGWRYDDTIRGDIHYRIESAAEETLPWSIHYDSDQSSSSSSPKLVFRSSAVTASAYEWTIHDKRTYDMLQKPGARLVIGGFAKLIGAFSDRMRILRDFYLSAQTLAAGSAAFQARYVLAAADPKWAALIDQEIERWILRWPPFTQSMSNRDNCFSAEFSHRGLKLQLYADAPDFVVIEQMAKLGQRLLAETRALRQ